MPPPGTVLSLFCFFCMVLIGNANEAAVDQPIRSSLPALPLSTSGRQIVDRNGIPVKLSCVNWYVENPLRFHGLGVQYTEIYIYFFPNTDLTRYGAEEMVIVFFPLNFCFLFFFFLFFLILNRIIL